MASQATKKKKQGKRPADRDHLEQKRFMEIDVDPGRDAELGWIDKAEDRSGAAGSKRREH